MVDTNWDGVGKELATELEPLFYVNQTNVMEALVKILCAEAAKAGKQAIPGKLPLCELHRAATLFLLNDAGCYRHGANVVLQAPDGSLADHRPPPWDEVEGLMAGFFADLSQHWEGLDPLQVAAFCLWRINWIHPFRNGNGRTARAFAYSCMCIKFGFWLPGDPTVVDLIMNDRTPYEAALRALDASAAKGSVDLTPMSDYLGGLLAIQLKPFMQAPAP